MWVACLLHGFIDAHKILCNRILPCPQLTKLHGKRFYLWNSEKLISYTKTVIFINTIAILILKYYSNIADMISVNIRDIVRIKTDFDSGLS